MNSGEPLFARKPTPVLRFGPNELDLDRYELRRGGQRISLAPIPLDLLITLVKHPGRLLTREELIGQLWGDKAALVDTRAGLNNAINRLRHVLNDRSDNPRYIETVIGRGYRFVGDVEWIGGKQTNGSPPLAEESPAAPPPEPERISAKLELVPLSSLPSATERKAARRPRFALGGSIVMLLAAILGTRYFASRAPAEFKLSQVTTNSGDNQVKAAAISPLGDRLVYADTAGVHLFTLQGGFSRSLWFPRKWQVEALAWTPDGESLLASGYSSDVRLWQVWSYRMTSGSAMEVLSDARQPVISPDGHRLATFNPSTNQIYLSEVDGTERRLLTSTGLTARFLSMAWSEDRSRIFALVEELKGKVNQGQPSPEIELHSSKQCRSIDVKTGRVLASTTADQFDELINPATRSRLLLFTNRVGASGIWQARIDSAGAILSTSWQTRTANIAHSLTLTHGGDKMSAVVERGQADVFLADLNGDQLEHGKRLTLDSRVDFPNTWTPDGKAIIFESDRGGSGFRLYRQQIDELSAEVLTDMPGQQVASQITPDGHYLLFRQMVGTKQQRWAGVYRMPLEGGAASPVHMQSDQDEVCCPARGSLCVERSLTDTNKIRFYALDPRTGTQRQIGETAARPSVFGDWTVSPDGKAAALPIHEPEHPKIEIVPLVPGASRELITVKSPGQLWNLHWAINRQAWYGEIRSGEQHRLCLINKSGDVRELYRSPYNTWALPSPDGKQLAYLDYTSDQNVWIWQR